MTDEVQTEYEKGFEAGWKAAAETVWRNRNHNRAMSGYAAETQADAMTRIYTSWPSPRPPRLENARPLSGTVVDSVVDTMLDSIDLYVVLMN